MACDNCKDPIYLNTTSTISTPKCADDCPTEIDCNGEVTYTDCIKTTVAFSCIGTSDTATQTEINQAVNDKLCENQAATCTVSVDPNDTCCGYLGDKLISGTGITITKNIATDTEGCKTLTISTNPSSLVWTTIVLPSPLTTIPTYQIPQFSNKDELGRVWFRGSFSFSSVFTKNSIANLSTTLPVNSKPQLTRTFWNGKGESSGSFPPQVFILPNGVIQIKNNSGADLNSKSIVSFDGFWIDTNV